MQPFLDESYPKRVGTPIISGISILLSRRPGSSITSRRSTIGCFVPSMSRNSGNVWRTPDFASVDGGGGQPSDGTRVLALVSDAFGGYGGIAQYNRDFLTALIASGCASSVFILARNQAYSESPPQHLRQVIPRGGRIGYSVSAVLAGLSCRPDIIFCGHVNLAPLAAFIARLRWAKLIVQGHGIEMWQPGGRFRRLAIMASDLVLCVSRFTRRMLLDWADIPPERVVVLPNTVRELFSPGDGCAFRRKLGLENRRVLLTVGRLNSGEQYKGQDRIIRAMPGFVAAGQDVVFVIIGDGDDRERLEAIARDEGVSDRVVFMGQCDAEQLVDAYRAADLFVMPSSGEGFGITFLEAMACGTPALGLAAGGAHDALADGLLGVIAEDETLAEAILRVLCGPKPCPEALANDVAVRFGPNIFETNVKAAVARLELGARGSVSNLALGPVESGDALPQRF
jgi:phosphatidyl-myo-inositol dimannoside synthase